MYDLKMEVSQSNPVEVERCIRGNYNN